MKEVVVYVPADVSKQSKVIWEKPPNYTIPSDIYRQKDWIASFAIDLGHDVSPGDILLLVTIDNDNIKDIVTWRVVAQTANEFVWQH